MDKKLAVKIAKDALKIIKSENIIAGHSFFRSVTVNKPLVRKNLSQLLNDSTCEICAKGALFLGYVDKSYTVESSEFGGISLGDREVCEVLRNAFSEEELDFIEYVYEYGVTGKLPANISRDKADSFYFQYDNDQELLEAILKNIIQNNGEFILP